MQRRFLALALTLLAATACRRSAPEAPPAAKAARAVEVLKDGRWLFTYVEPAGTFTTTDKPDSVPAGSRALVRVFDPSDPAKTDAPGQVYVTDLNEVLKSGKAPARALSREAFETAALAQLPPGASSALAERGSGDDPGQPRRLRRRLGTNTPNPNPSADFVGALADCHDLRYLVVRGLPLGAPVPDPAPHPLRRQGCRARSRGRARAGGKGGQARDSHRPSAYHRRAWEASAGLRSGAHRRALGRTDMTRRTSLTPRILVVATLALAAVALAARPAEARLLDLRAGMQAGGMSGWGTTPNTPDFFERKRGPGLGAEVGARLLILDVSLRFTQLFDGDGRNGTFLQALLGIAIDVPVGNQLFRDGMMKGKSRHIIRPAAGVGFGFGTPEPIDPPLDNAQISDKGIFPYLGAGYEFFLNEFVGVGAQADFAYHYFFGGGMSTLAANQNYSTGYHFSGFATLMFHLGV